VIIQIIKTADPAIIEVLVPGQQGIPGQAAEPAYETVAQNLAGSDFELNRDVSSGRIASVDYASGISKVFERSADGKVVKITLVGGVLPISVKRVKNLTRDADGRLASVAYSHS
jgi:hypothetical protein